MRRLSLLILSALFPVLVLAQVQNENPVVMTVGDYQVHASEFEYFLERNYAEETAPDYKMLKKYADLYLDFKMKVQSAVSRGMDRTDTFIEEYNGLKEDVALSFLVDSTYLEETAYETFLESAREVGPEGIIMLSVIAVIPETMTEKDVVASAHLIDSIYSLLERGGNFRELAMKYSNNEFSRNGGEVGWVSRSQLPEDVADEAMKLKVGEYSKPFISDEGFLILKVWANQKFDNYQEHRSSIYEWMENQGEIMATARRKKAEKLIAAAGLDLTVDQFLMNSDSLLEVSSDEYQNAIREYHDGLLFFDISSEELWDKANNDEEGLNAFFEKNRKKYSFDEPLFKGMLFFCKDETVFRQIEKALSDHPMSEWVDIITGFNSEGPQVRVMKGPFQKGANQYIDCLVFKEGSFEPMDKYPYTDVIGHTITKPEEPSDVAVQVMDDYQLELEKAWMKKLRKEFKCKVNNKELKKLSLKYQNQ